MKNSMSFLASPALVPSVVVIDFSGFQLPADAVLGHATGRGVAHPLVAKGDEVDVVRGDVAGITEANQLSAPGTRLAVVLGEVGMKVHAKRYT